MAFDVFLSYPHQDKAVADAACAKLEAAGIRCWIAPRDIAPSADWASSIIDAIDNCHVMVLIFSAHTNRSKQVSREVQQAFDGEKPVIPFRIENVTPEKSLRYYMGSVHWLDALTPPIEQHLQKLTASVQALIMATASEAASQTERTRYGSGTKDVEELRPGQVEKGKRHPAGGRAVQQSVAAEQIARDAEHHERAEGAEPEWRGAAIEALRKSEALAGTVSRTRAWSVRSLWTGRIDRFGYFIGCVLCVLAALATVGLWAIAGTLTDSNPHLVGLSGFAAVSSVGLSGLVAICAAGIWSVLSIRRLHDIGRTGWWSSLGVVPLVNYILIGYLLLKKGSSDMNRYGSPPITEERGVFRKIVNA